MTDMDVSQLARAIAELADKTGHGLRRTALTDLEALEVERITLSHGGMFRPSPADLETSGSYEDEVLRLTSVSPDLFYSSSARRHAAAARSRADSRTLALSRSTAEPAQGQLVSKYGLPITYGGSPVLDTPQNRAAFARVLPPLIVDADSGDSSIDTDVVGTLARRAQGLGSDDPDYSAGDPRVPSSGPVGRVPAVDTGSDMPGPSDWGVEHDQPGNMHAGAPAPWRTGDVASEVARLQAVHGSAISGLRPGAKRSTDGTGKFSSRQARLSGVLQGV